MPRPSLPLLLLAALPILSCDPQPTQPSGGAGEPALDPVTATAELRYAPRFDPDNFVRVVDNRFFPLKPGTRFVYFGEEDGEAEKNVTVVTQDRKDILGISAIVVLDQVFVHGELKEKTFDWYAQDKNGNVWYLGEDTKEFEDGKVVSTEGSWRRAWTAPRRGSSSGASSGRPALPSGVLRGRGGGRGPGGGRRTRHQRALRLLPRLSQNL